MADDTPDEDRSTTAPGQGGPGTTGGVPAPAPPADSGLPAPETPASASGDKTSEAGTSESATSGDKTPESGASENAAGGEEAVAPSGALDPEVADEPFGELDPATGGPRTVTAPPPAEPVDHWSPEDGEGEETPDGTAAKRPSRAKVTAGAPGPHAASTSTNAGTAATGTSAGAGTASTGSPAGGAADPEAPDPAHDVEQRRREAGVNPLFPFGRPGQPLGRYHPFVFGFTAALGVMTAYLLIKAATNAKSVLVMIVVAMFLAVGLNPAVERLRRLGLPRGAAVGAVFLIVILFFAGFVASLVQPVTEQVTELRHSIPDFVNQLQNNRTLADWDKRYGLLARAEKAVNSQGFQNGLTDTATGIGKVAINGVFQTITILILTLYFMSSLPQIKTFFYQLAPRSRRARVALLGDEILDRIGGYVAGQFTIAFIAGLCSYIFLSILGVKYALALALIVAVTDLVPLIGATIGAVIVCLVAFLTGTTTDLIVCGVFYVVYQQVENYLVYPRVMKRTVDVQPAVTIVAALVGAALLGVVGALLAIPTAAAISLLIREVVVPRQETL